MLKKCNGILNILISLIIGVFMGYVIDVFWAYKTIPLLYVVLWARWYSGVFFLCIVLLIIFWASFFKSIIFLSN